MTKQVLSIEQMLHLQKLGITPQETLLYWAREVATGPRAANHYGQWILVKGKGCATIGLTHWEYVPAFTLQDVLDLLPKQIGIEYIYDLYMSPESISYVQFVGGEINDILYEIPINGNLIDAACEMLLWCIGKGIISTRKEERP